MKTLKQITEEQGISGYRLAKEAGLSRALVNYFITGKQSLWTAQYNSVAKIAAALGYKTTEDFIRETVSPEEAYKNDICDSLEILKSIVSLVLEESDNHRLKYLGNKILDSTNESQLTAYCDDFRITLKNTIKSIEIFDPVQALIMADLHKNLSKAQKKYEDACRQKDTWNNLIE